MQGNKEILEAKKVARYAKQLFLVDGELKAKTRGICNALPEQEVLAEELLKLLGRRRTVWEGGSFRVVLTKVKKEYRDKFDNVWKRYIPELFELQFLDRDGDIQFVIEYPDDAFTLIDHKGVSTMGDEAEEAFDRWKSFKGIIDIRPEQTFKQAQGEAPITGIDAPQSMISGA